MKDKEFEYKLLKDTEEAIFDYILLFIGMTIMCIPAILIL